MKETLIRYLFKTKVNRKDTYYAMQLIESDPVVMRRWRQTKPALEHQGGTAGSVLKQ